MGREFELKFRAEPEQLAAIAAKIGEFFPIDMETTYYDTTDHALSDLRWTLRRRQENDASVCTLKTPLPDGSRGEWELECPSIEEAVPALSAMEGSGMLERLTEFGVVRVCGARFRRLARVLELEQCTVELALDRGELLGGKRMLPFAEVEVELKAGREEEAVRFARDLAAEFGLTPEKRSKYRRALDLAYIP